MTWGAALLDLIGVLAFGALTGGMGWVLHARRVEGSRR